MKKIDEEGKEAEEKLAVVLERQLYYLSELAIWAVCSDIWESPGVRLFIVVSEVFNEELPRAPFAAVERY